jgi:hypothetical protein
MPSSGLETAIPTVERKQTYTLDRMATQGPQYVPKSQNLSVSPCLREPSAILSAPTDEYSTHSWPCVVFRNIACYIQIKFQIFTVNIPN